MGLLAITDSVHSGMVASAKIETKSQINAVVTGSTLIRGVPINFYFYKPYKNKETINELLTQSKLYSVKITHAN